MAAMEPKVADMAILQRPDERVQDMRSTRVCVFVRVRTRMCIYVCVRESVKSLLQAEAPEQSVKAVCKIW
eukprot:1156510-Pelagomonas_calceolata.AAC.9